MYNLFINDVEICSIDSMYEVTVKYEDGTRDLRLQMVRHNVTAKDLINYPDYNAHINNVKLIDENGEVYWESNKYTYLSKVMISYFDELTITGKILLEFDRSEKI